VVLLLFQRLEILELTEELTYSVLKIILILLSLVLHLTSHLLEPLKLMNLQVLPIFQIHHLDVLDKAVLQEVMKKLYLILKHDSLLEVVFHGLHQLQLIKEQPSVTTSNQVFHFLQEVITTQQEEGSLT